MRSTALGVAVALTGLVACGKPRPGTEAQAAHATAAPVSASASSPPPTPDGAALEVVHRAGQTFITFPEKGGERFRLYRGSAPLNAAALAALKPLAEVAVGSARAYGDRYRGESDRYAPRVIERLVVDPAQGQVPEGRGLFVVTLHPEDLGGAAEGLGHYAVAALPEPDASPVWVGAAPPVTERVAPLAAVRVSSSADGLGHAYVQYMDARRWNGTFHAPRAGNRYLGLNDDLPGVSDAEVFAYTYQVSEPDPKSCGDKPPERLPVLLNLHGWGDDRYALKLAATPWYCAIQIEPSDLHQTWWFGFAKGHDFRKGGLPAAGDVVVNYTEQRLLRMVQDLLADPKLGPRVDPNRVYVFGHSMGGTGALALATRYPQVFAAAYASQPMTAPDDAGPWVADAAMKWGEPATALPIELDAPQGLATALTRYAGMPVWRWQSHALQVRERLADEMAPFGVSHGRADKVLPFATQGRPAYAALDAGRRAWGGLVNDNEHSWAAFGGLPANLAPDRSLAPFYGFKVVRNEPVPGLSASSGNAPLPPTDAAGAPSSYNAGLEWAASWNPFADPPEDTAARFCVSLRTTADSPAASVEVDVTPRRTQAFRPSGAVRAEVTGPDGKVRPLQVETPIPGLVTARRVPVGRAPVRVCVLQGTAP